MNFLFKKVRVLNVEIPVVVIIWFAFASFASVAEVLRHTYNDYLIYQGEFRHTLQQKNLYLEYPQEYGDINHNGPLFSLVIAPFALLPTEIGIIIWGVANAAILLYAIRKLPLTEKQQLVIVAVAAIDMMTSTYNLQVNPAVTAWLILAFVLVEKEKDFWATLFIVLGFFVKLYGIAGILFFVFSKHKIKFIGSFIFWCIILFCLPMLLAPPKFIVQSYYDWYQSLVIKDVKNADIIASGGMQDLSVMGIIRRIFTYPSLNILYVLAPAALLIAAPILRFKQYAAKEFRFSYLAIVLISTVIFSTAAESPTYVIAMTGAGIWYVIQRKEKAVIFVLALAILLTSLSSTDLFPKFIKDHFIRAYALKAFPCFLIWILLIVSVSVKDFVGSKNKLQTA